MKASILDRHNYKAYLQFPMAKFDKELTNHHYKRLLEDPFWKDESNSFEFSIADKLRNISFLFKIGKDLSYDYEECIEKENTAVFKSVGQFIGHNQ